MDYLKSSEMFFLARDRAIIKAINERKSQAKSVLNLCYAAAGLDPEKDSLEESSIFCSVKLI